MSLEWRVIDCEEKDGISNTALDLALLEEVAEDKSEAIITFTNWKPTVSLGNSQNYFLDIDEEACKKKNVDIVRRKSGGQAVYLDDGYFVFSIIAKPEILPRDLTRLREWFCYTTIGMLKELQVKTEFYPPDNIIHNDREKLKTLGNSGQVITNKAVVIHGSLRYKLNLDAMLEVLKVNGHNLEPFKKEIGEILADIKTLNSNIKKEDLRNGFLNSFTRINGSKYFEDELNNSELEKIEQIKSEIGSKKYKLGEPNFKSKGICYFFLNGQNLVKVLQPFLPYNKPSTVLDSTIQAGVN